ncbi:hypothetical protein OROMI_027290 [Orobanche minor]
MENEYSSNVEISLSRLSDHRDSFKLDNLPIYPKEEVDQIRRTIHSIFSESGVIDEVIIPVDPDTGETVGFCIIDYKHMHPRASKQTEEHDPKLLTSTEDFPFPKILPRGGARI